jgi:hypothetical protein
LRTSPLSFLLRFFLALAAVQVASGYTYILSGSSNLPERWPPGSIVMHIQLGTQPTTLDGNVSQAVYNAMQLWNAQLATVQFTGLIEAPAPGTYTDGGGTNEMFFNDTLYGTALGPSTLAVTTGWTQGNRRTEADMVFNTAYTWDSFIGAVSSTGPIDIKRVVLHELGHMLGLDHPDQAVPKQTVPAIMNSVISNTIISLQPDDILGAQNLYGMPGGSAPANDNFANAIPLALTNGAYQAKGSNIFPNAASREPGEPLITGNAGGHSVWWSWQAPASGLTYVDTRGSLLDTTLGVYTGSAVNALTLVASNNDENDDLPPEHIYTSRLSFTATAGTTYYIAVDGWYSGATSGLFGEVGAITVNVNFVGIVVAPGFTLQPADATVPVGATVQYTVAASGTPAPTLRWQRLPAGSTTWANLGNIQGYSGVTTGTLTVSRIAAAMNGDQFRCKATNLVSTATSNAAVLNVTSLGVLGDLNGDGESDIVLTNSRTGERAIWLMNGSSIGAGASLGVLSTNWQISATGDFNDDTMSDLVLTNMVTGERAIWLMNGTSIGAGVSLGVLPTSWVISGTGDFNGDGNADILLSNTVTGERAIWLMNGTSISAGASLGVFPTSWTISGTGDFDGDGKSDILLTNTSGERAIWLMNGTSISAGTSLGILPSSWAISGTGDFSGNGRDDILLTNTNGDRAIWLMNGASITAGADLGILPTNWVFSRVGDFDGDGKADIFLTNTVTGERAVWLMNGTSITAGTSLGIISTDWLIRN